MGVCLMMFFGTGTMISAKLMLETKVPDMDGDVKKFSKAIYQSLLMFFAMSMCYPWYQIAELVMPPKKAALNVLGVNNQDDATQGVAPKTFAKKLIVWSLDCFALVLICTLKHFSICRI